MSAAEEAPTTCEHGVVVAAGSVCLRCVAPPADRQAVVDAALEAGDLPGWVRDKGLPVPCDELRHAYRTMLMEAEGEDANRDGLRDTPKRAAKAWLELTRGYRTPAPELRTFEADHDEIVAVAPIPFYSLCEHHLLPFHGTAHVAYLPGERILGLSKFARLVDWYARRLSVQERLTSQIADHLTDALSPGGVAVVLRAEHLCMTMRGAQVPGAITTTSVLRGTFRDQPAARAEVLDLLLGTLR